MDRLQSMRVFVKVVEHGGFARAGAAMDISNHHLGQLSVVMAYPSRRLLSAKVRSFVDFMNAQFPHPETDSWLPRAV